MSYHNPYAQTPEPATPAPGTSLYAPSPSPYVAASPMPGGYAPSPAPSSSSIYNAAMQQMQTPLPVAMTPAAFDPVPHMMQPQTPMVESLGSSHHHHDNHDDDDDDHDAAPGAAKLKTTTATGTSAAPRSTGRSKPRSRKQKSAEVSQDILPDDLKDLVACMICSLLKNANQFEANGCENCSQVLEELGIDQENTALTTKNFEGMVALMKPDVSWTGRWQSISKFQPGLYAVGVFDRPPKEVVRELANQGLWRARDGRDR
ncbi:hypothetical protein CAOG_08697 [Capsaspora owczarzaki ATCC 30864]|uniref:Spt4/RpoE2 zinc finger domain-containing protein n=1 Tax=Capsaspora owczarzaki (strain ATCC 30864) TaxID=595528 RepID=A0A0D2WP66_CAPO3|nr:hypothetical protein CAOG_08697 [Capsaspora owczarzaki ATCC 30864]KJE92388.1 hypothetical protein CAOG_008697 [Capsaspora owczarzaki ATCC 30864]|eukprot:XP_011270308.1 hypothetical protein CAOG_08697 [Capsaspora owczarzaki ATCC 30864]